MMIVAVLALFAYAYDKELGIVYALILPPLVAIGTPTNNFAEVLAVVILSLALRFVKLGIQEV